MRNRAFLASILLVGCSSSSEPAGPATDGATDGAVDGSSDAPVGSSSTLAYEDEAITLDGAQVPKLLGVAGETIAAFRFVDGAWIEIPVQIDPREVRSFATALAKTDKRAAIATAATTSFYTDSNLAPGGPTYVGVDSDPKFDADDELVILASDFGGQADGSAPVGVTAASRTEIKAFDGGDESHRGYAYLFQRTGAGSEIPARVAMTVSFPTSTGNFSDFYATGASNNTGTSRGCGSGPWGVVYPEDTTIKGAGYERHFSGRWLSDAMRVNGKVDLLDTQEERPRFTDLAGDVGATIATLSPTGSGGCGRSVTSFSGGPGTIVTLRGGKLRAIRSVFGANSGTITQRTNVFYPRKEDQFTYVRVHPIPGVSDVLDLAESAVGMTYYNERNTAGLPVDGKPETYDRSFSRWEMVTGEAQGTLLSLYRNVLVDLGADTASFPPQMVWLDAGKESDCVCSGDSSMIGVHGIQLFNGTTPLPNTDPLRGDAGQIFFLRSLHYLEGKTTPEVAALRSKQALDLKVSIDSGAPFDPYAITCGDGVCEANETSANCNADCKPVAGGSSCGDGKCVEGEQFVCLGDCPPKGHADYFACLKTSCSTPFSACGSDPGCTDGLTCLESCTGTFADCNKTCAMKIADPGSRSIGAALAMCANTPCGSKF